MLNKQKILKLLTIKIKNLLEYNFHILSFHFNKWKGLGFYLFRLEGFVVDKSLLGFYYIPFYKKLKLAIFFVNFEKYLK